MLTAEKFSAVFGFKVKNFKRRFQRLILGEKFIIIRV